MSRNPPLLVSRYTPLHVSPLRLKFTLALTPALSGPQVGSSWVAHRLLHSVGSVESLERPLPRDLSLSANCGGVGSQGLGGAHEQRPRLSRGLVRGWTGPLCAVCCGGVVGGELGGLRWSGGGGRVAQGALAGGQRGSGGGVCGEVGGAS